MSVSGLNNFDVEPQKRRSLSKLIETSHKRPMNFADVLPWEQGIDKSKPPKLPEHCWFYGTPYYDKFTDEQKQELLWLQVARDISMFITLEQTLPVLYMGYINKYAGDLSKEVTEYLMIFSKEEIVHTMMFKRYLNDAELPLYNSEYATKNLLERLPDMHPIMGILYTLILEWVAELGAIHSTQSESVEPLTKELFNEHHIDEARHISFGKWICESYIKNASSEEHKTLVDMITPMMDRLIPAFTFNVEIAKYTSFDLPFSVDDEEVIAAIRQSESNQALNQKRFAPIYKWVSEQGLYEQR
jgi:hypothetical protein